jgi:hypothetical protein
MRVLTALLLAALAALAAALAAGSVDERYEATTSGRIQPLIPLLGVDRLRATAGLPRLEDDPRTPFLPGGGAALERIVERSARALGLARAPDIDDVRVIDTESELVFPKYKEPVRRLKVKVRADDPDEAARLANGVFRSYLLERERVIVEGLQEARRRLAEGGLPRRASLHLRAEAVEAVDITIRLGAGLLVGSRRPARAPEEPILPHIVRDALVAAVIGALLGWLGGSWRRRSQLRSASAS